MNHRPLHILLVNNYTVRGGIPKSLCTLANAMIQRGHRVSIYSQKPVARQFGWLYRLGYRLYELSLPAGTRPTFPRGTSSLEEMYPLDPAVTVIPYTITDNNLRIQRLRQRLRELAPDVCVCADAGGNQLIWAVILLGSGIPFVYSERHSPRTIEDVFWNRKGRLAAMSGADYIHLLLPSFRASLPDFLQDRARIIPNGISIPARAATPAGPQQGRKILLWLGRLHEELKQCRLAMDAFASLADRHPDWEMRIIGDGQDRQLIDAHAQALGLGDRLRLMGETSDAETQFAQAHAYCFSSRTEGMPNALLEAMAAGLPCVGFAGCEGVSDLIEHERTGLIVDDMTAPALARALDRLMDDAALRQELGRAARASLESFEISACMDAWEQLLLDAAAQKGHSALDAFAGEPFASRARLAAAARREWLWRDFGRPMPDSLEGVLYWFLWKAPQCQYRRLLSRLKGK